METKPLLYGLVGFFIGGLLVAVAATAMDKPTAENDLTNELSMSAMTASLADKTGDDYDKAFIDYMIDHHQSAVDMAKLSARNAKHDEIKTLSLDIIAAQEKEIDEMRQWQTGWGYSSTSSHSTMNH